MAQKNKICIIFTGGTIGSVLNGNNIKIDKNAASLLVTQYKAFNPDIEFDELRPIDILSENITKNEVYSIYNTIKNIDQSLYDGIILTHGTDTLCFSANYLSQVLCDIKIPLVIVSALYPLQDERSNGLDNFAGAISFIYGAGVKGVFASFKNPNENCKIHLASRLTYSDQISGYFNSLLDVCFGEIVDGNFIYNENPNNPTAADINKNYSALSLNELCTDIVVIQARALLDFSYYNFKDKKPKAVLVQLYHSGTVCTVGEETSFVKFANYCRKNNIPVICSPVYSKASIYESVKNLDDNCIIAYDMSFEMTIVKTMTALQYNYDLADYLKNDNKFFEKI